MAKKKRKTAAQTKKNTARRAPRILLTLFLILFLLLPAMNGIGYELIFSRIRVSIPDAEGSRSVPVPPAADGLSFPTEDGTEAYAALYHDALRSAPPKALILLVPGIASTGLDYMPLIAAFTEEGYAVLSLEDVPYSTIAEELSDADDEDEKYPIADAGLPSALIRLRAALAYIKNENALLSRLPLILFGHSRGAYAAGSVLSFEEADAAVLVSAFDSSGDMLLEKAKGSAGPAAYLFYPYARFYELVKFGPYAGASVTKGALDSDTPILIIQALDDKTVPAEKGILRFEEALKDDADVRFLPLDTGGHTPAYEGALLDAVLAFVRENVPEP